MEKLDLAQRWAKMWHDAGYTDTCRFMFDQLVALYSASGRHYHILAHIEFCLDMFDRFRSVAKDPLAVQLAIWFHDAIYDASRTDNELRSAEFFLQFAELIGLPKETRKNVYRMIIATTHKASDRCRTRDGYLVVDIDLSSLALEWEEFDKNTKEILQEGKDANVSDYESKNRKFLHSIRRRVRIYLIKEFRSAFEQKARTNLRRRLRV